MRQGACWPRRNYAPCRRFACRFYPMPYRQSARHRRRLSGGHRLPAGHKWRAAHRGRRPAASRLCRAISDCALPMAGQAARKRPSTPQGRCHRPAQYRAQACPPVQLSTLPTADRRPAPLDDCRALFRHSMRREFFAPLHAASHR